jgi:leucyl-tRNA synthetase
MGTGKDQERDTAARSYDFAAIEAKWQQRWEERRQFATPEVGEDSFYMLVMFAYPSGDIHIGHFRNYIIGDAVAHYQRMQGKQVFHPFGWDAFGLPAEQAAIKRGLAPRDWTLQNIEVSRNTLKKVGISFDWEREVTSCLPEYYKWNQWIFLKLFERGLAYRRESIVNFCETCNTVLANEQVLADGSCWRCENQVGKKKLLQWYFKITEYAERLLEGLERINWPDRVKAMQRNWIGKSEGSELTFKLESGDLEIPIFTTRPDTTFGVTFMAVAPEAELLERLEIPAEKQQAVADYIAQALRKSEVERQADTDEKDGVFTGLYATNPLSNERVQIWVADYVLASYGTGVVMGVPAHDQRDFLFAKRYDIPIRVVIKPPGEAAANPEEMTEAYIEPAEMCNSGQFDGRVGREAMTAVTEFAAEQGIGRAQINYRLRDWLISRQRYWGTPIPIIHCDDCGEVPVPVEKLPVKLPDEIENFIPKGRSPLEDVSDWVNVACPKCGKQARRDADTMDTFVDSSWYQLRYCDNKNQEAIFDSKRVNSWNPVGLYVGGIDHATGHLIYIRFITKFLHDLGLIDFDEPATRLFNHGMVLDDSGRKMSKSFGNVVSPMDLIAEHGVDNSRLAMYFTAPSEKEIPWSGNTLTGIERFTARLHRTIQIAAEHAAVADLSRRYTKAELTEVEWLAYVHLNRTIARIAEDFERLQFNTCVAALMEFHGNLSEVAFQDEGFRKYLVARMVQLLAPLAPHLAEESWELLGFRDSIFVSSWPKADLDATKFDLVTVAIQVNGKVRGQIEIERTATEEQVREAALAQDNVARHLSDKEIKKIIYIKAKLVSIVAK